MYRYLESTKFVENKKLGQVVLSNAQNGTWIKLPVEWKKLVDRLVKYEGSYQNFLRLFESQDDKVQFENLINILSKKGFITDCQEIKVNGIKSIYFALTERCNLRCKHCCYDAIPMSAQTDLQKEDMIKILNIIADAHPDMIVLSGGEPLIREDFMELLLYLRECYSGKITLSTNALLINEKNIRQLVKNIDHFAISLDGYNEESCALIRGKGIFERVIDKVRNLKELGASEISLSMVQIDQDKKGVEKFKQLNSELGTKPVIRVLAPVGRASNLLDGERYIRNVYKKSTILDSDVAKLSDSCIACKCGGASRDFLINYDGNVYPCGLMIDKDYKMGNILEYNSMKEFLQVYKTTYGYHSFQEIMPENFSACKECEVNVFCWHCLQELDQAKHHPELIPLRCSIRKENLYKLIWG